MAKIHLLKLCLQNETLSINTLYILPFFRFRDLSKKVQIVAHTSKSSVFLHLPPARFDFISKTSVYFNTLRKFPVHLSLLSLSISPKKLCRPKNPSPSLSLQPPTPKNYYFFTLSFFKTINYRPVD